MQVCLYEYQHGEVITTHEFDTLIDVNDASPQPVEMITLEDGCIGFHIKGKRSALLFDIDPISGAVFPNAEGEGWNAYIRTHIRLSDMTEDENPMNILKFDIHGHRWSISSFDTVGAYRHVDDYFLLWRDQLLYWKTSDDDDDDDNYEWTVHCERPYLEEQTKKENWLDESDGWDEIPEDGRQFRGDDEFIVAFGFDGYTVWSFPAIDPLPLRRIG